MHDSVNKKDPAHDVEAPSQQVIQREVRSKSSEEIRQGGNLRIFTYQDLKSATRNFRPDSLLGEGGFGSVYKGWIDEHGTTAAKAGTGLTVAVKQLNQEGLQGHREWLVSFLFPFDRQFCENQWQLSRGPNIIDAGFVTYTTIVLLSRFLLVFFFPWITKPAAGLANCCFDRYKLYSYYLVETLKLLGNRMDRLRTFFVSLCDLFF